MIEPGRTLPFADVGCAGAKSHRPVPLISERHHVFPVYLQARVWDDVDPGRPSTAHTKTLANLCGNCHATTHVVIDALIQGRSIPAHVPTKTLEIARQGFKLYAAAAAAAKT